MTDSLLTVCLFSIDPSLLERTVLQLKRDSFVVHSFEEEEDYLRFVFQQEQLIDCLILEVGAKAQGILMNFKTDKLLLPCVLLEGDTPDADVGRLDRSSDVSSSDSDVDLHRGDSVVSEFSFYHNAVHSLSMGSLDEIRSSIEKAINAFLSLPDESPLLGNVQELSNPSLSHEVFNSLSNKQRQLSSKLQERLGYRGVYYKRNPDSFLRSMSPSERQTFLTTLSRNYRDIILNYFSDHSDLNAQIDRYVTTAFFADVPTSQIVQIHMELMDEFSKQLKLEGRNEEILLDYRLTLIDILANLCELYRRSIPRL